jgi:hypothetical protein
MALIVRGKYRNSPSIKQVSDDPLGSVADFGDFGDAEYCVPGSHTAPKAALIFKESLCLLCGCIYF